MMQKNPRSTAFVIALSEELDWMKTKKKKVSLPLGLLKIARLHISCSRGFCFSIRFSATTHAAHVLHGDYSAAAAVSAYDWECDCFVVLLYISELWKNGGPGIMVNCPFATL